MCNLSLVAGGLPRLRYFLSNDVSVVEGLCPLLPFVIVLFGCIRVGRGFEVLSHYLVRMCSLSYLLEGLRFGLGYVSVPLGAEVQVYRMVCPLFRSDFLKVWSWL